MTATTCQPKIGGETESIHDLAAAPRSQRNPEIESANIEHSGDLDGAWRGEDASQEVAQNARDVVVEADPQALASLIYGSLAEAAFWIADGEDGNARLAQGGACCTCCCVDCWCSDSLMGRGDSPV